jgi:hypothetical protein
MTVPNQISPEPEGLDPVTAAPCGAGRHDLSALKKVEFAFNSPIVISAPTPG